MTCLYGAPRALAAVLGLGVSPTSHPPRWLRDAGGGKQKEARLYSVIYFFFLPQGRKETTGNEAVAKAPPRPRESLGMEMGWWGVLAGISAVQITWETALPRALHLVMSEQEIILLFAWGICKKTEYNGQWAAKSPIEESLKPRYFGRWEVI